MSGMAPHRARAAALPASLFALLVLLCLPVVSQASPPSYEDDPPTVPGEVKQQPDPKARGSNANVGGGTTSDGRDGSTTDAGSGSKKDSSDEGGGVAPGKGGDGGNDQGSPGDAKLGDGEKIAQNPSQTGTITDPASGDDSGGSSPLAPILIAIAVLAAISIGVVLMRQRRHGDDGDNTASPEAG